MKDVFSEFKSLFEKRYNIVSVLSMGEDSVRYDFFNALQKIKSLEPCHLQLEYPFHENCFIPRRTSGSKRNEKPQLDLWINEPSIKLCAEFGMFRRNSQDDSSIAVTENTIKMLNDFIRLALQAYNTKCDAYFICVADSKMMDYQLKKMQTLPAFPGDVYQLQYNTIETLLSQYKSAKKFDMRFVNQKKELQLIVNANLEFKQEIFSALNPLRTFVLVWKVSGSLAEA